MCTNLYGCSMSQFIPWGEFKWLTDEEISQFCPNDIPDDSKLGYILDVARATRLYLGYILDVA